MAPGHLHTAGSRERNEIGFEDPDKLAALLNSLDAIRLYVYAIYKSNIWYGLCAMYMGSLAIGVWKWG